MKKTVKAPGSWSSISQTGGPRAGVNDPEIRKKIEAEIPLGRLGEPSEAAYFDDVAPLRNLISFVYYFWFFSALRLRSGP